MSSHALPYHTTESVHPAEGDRCAQCDRVFELGDRIASYPVTCAVPGKEVRFAHFHEGCAIMVFPASVTPVVSRNAGFDRPNTDSKATAA